MEFQVLKQSKKSFARYGILKTPHGEIETPSLVIVATNATVKTLSPKEVKETKSQILICNTFHLHLKAGEKIINKAGGLHYFMGWNGPLMTDSGGFQVFSFGFARDLGIGKILKIFPGKTLKKIDIQDQPKLLKITYDGVLFKCPIDGKEIFLGPKESIKIQEKLGADIIFTFDECTPPTATFEYTKNSLLRNHHWAKICLKEKKSDQALFGIVHGGKYKKLRKESARFFSKLHFEGYGIGGDLGNAKTTMLKILEWVIPELPLQKPRHLLGIGHLEDIPEIIKRGVDLFDCTVPTLYARHGVAFTSKGKLNLKKSKFLLKYREPLDKNCDCQVCQNYKTSYLSHLIRANEILGLRLVTFHNLYFFNNFVQKIREKIKNGKI
ncbi:tRNA guanosine(34) transglycosylase Tgt [Candidatus Parcubacteria bacterium]|nr:tRNA guanosine(34) transglycosylase Tgt [Candidatus Parcubacteria bacterium]